MTDATLSTIPLAGAQDELESPARREVVVA